MRREELVDLNAFQTGVAEEQSFTRAAAKLLGTSQSALSYTVRRLEARLGVRLLTRTTRRVAPTEAGERRLKTLGPALEDIAAELAALSELRDKPSGTIRITTSEHAANAVLWPVLEKLLPKYLGPPCRAGYRLGSDRYRRATVRRWGPSRRVGCQGYGSGPYRA